MYRVLAEAEKLLRAFGKDGLDWGKDGADAHRSLGRVVHKTERGRLPVELMALVRVAIKKLLSDGRAVRQGDAIVWAECVATEEAAG